MLNASIEGQTIVMNDKTFSTGSTGYHGVGKIVLNGAVYQCNLMVIKVGSKPIQKKK
jgi:hypothetical protein